MMGASRADKLATTDSGGPLKTKKPVLVNQPNTLEFRLQITCEDDYFGPDRHDCREALADLLFALGHRLQGGETFGVCTDIRTPDGNTVGQASLKTREEHEQSLHHDAAAYWTARNR